MQKYKAHQNKLLYFTRCGNLGLVGFSGNIRLDLGRGFEQSKRDTSFLAVCCTELLGLNCLLILSICVQDYLY